MTTQDTLQAALTALAEGRHDEARRGFERVLASEPDHPIALHWAAVIAYQQGTAADAVLGQIDRAIALDGGQALFHNSRGALLYALGRDLEAAESFHRAVLLNDQDGPVWNNLGNALLRLNRVDEAENCYRQALAVAPGLISAINNLGVALKRRGRLDKALICFREAILHMPDFQDAHFNLGELYYHLDMIPEAEAEFRRCIELNAEFHQAHASLAQCLHDQDKREEALTLLREAHARFPDDEDIDFMLRLQFSSIAPAWHIPMVNDEERNQAYDLALRRAVKPGDLVLEIGTGSGLVAMMAARAGAGRVVTCEVLPLMGDIAREVVAKNGLSDRITVITRKSTQVQVGTDLPDRADVFVSELINIGMMSPNMIPVLQHAREALLKPDAKIIPAAATVYGALIEAPQLARINPVRQISGFDLSPLDKLRSPGYAQIDLAADLVRQISQPFKALEFDFRRNMPERDARLLQVTATSAGVVHGIAFWFDLVMDEETVYSSASTTRTNHWKQAAEFFPQPVAVQPGDRFMVIAGYDNTRIFFKGATL
ncbi:MAG TPA: tetratricopeptide repeat protein [Dongiaceae bacterium]|nr:tetratricopeptide repeat protein [Dongiaceae bacterium]